MAGIYVHIPFCRKACHYCNFHFSTSFGVQDEMMQALAHEIRLQAAYLEKEKVDTIYFGGGTPSAIPAIDIARLLEEIYATFSISDTPEITLEANPDDIHTPNLQAWKQTGINRLSIGIQAFQDHLLHKWNRSHNGRQGIRCLRHAQDSGLTNITADLIYGDPDMSDAEWDSNIETLAGTGVPHVSAYALTVEEKTALSYQIQQGQSRPLDEAQASHHYAMLQEKMAAHGFAQYEVSNFAKPGYTSRHNSRYWSGDFYLGIGPSAHSYNGESRQWNVAHNIRYIESIASGIVPFEKETLTKRDMYNEIVMTGLRTDSGINLVRVRQLGEEFENYLVTQLQSHLDAGKVLYGPEDYVRLRPEYFFFADGMASELFMAPTP